ncbi:Translocon-associated protein subunit alpha [Sciurus carolinensis]|uniref:Translocon-associated protein subunit alpha n=1 Tax=Sciurus carolinensis TaxID=30640 RepID=A0AA41N893_SCICA|nr:Translocon-associated protein subunit alpha [Sciurus carolinensis]
MRLLPRLLLLLLLVFPATVLLRGGPGGEARGVGCRVGRQGDASYDKFEVGGGGAAAPGDRAAGARAELTPRRSLGPFRAEGRAGATLLLRPGPAPCRGDQSWRVRGPSRRLGGGGLRCAGEGCRQPRFISFGRLRRRSTPILSLSGLTCLLAATLGVRLNSFAETPVFCTPMLLEHLFLVFCLRISASDSCSLAVAQDLTEDEETVEDSIIEDEDDEAEVEEDEPTDLAEDKEEEDVSGEPEASPSADTTILFVKGEDFPANNIVKFLVGFTNKGTEDFIVESLDASFRYPQDYQFYIQNFTALPLNTVVPPQRQATFEYSFIPAEPMGGRPFGLVINLNYKDLNGNVFQDAVFNQTVTVIEREDGLDGETIFMYMFLAGLGLLVVVGLHQLLESRKRKRPIQKVEMGTSSQNDVDMSWIPQETLNQISK